MLSYRTKFFIELGFLDVFIVLLILNLIAVFAEFNIINFFMVNLMSFMIFVALYNMFRYNKKMMEENKE